MGNLLKVVEILKSKRETFSGRYFIPEAWNYFGYPSYSADRERAGEISVNPYDFVAACLEKQILSRARADEKKSRLEDNQDEPARARLNEKTPSQERGGLSRWNPSAGNIYGMLVRSFTAWNHHDSSRVDPGTFLKAICLLPYIRTMGVDLIYLLPVFERGVKYKKGELGSIYAIKDLYKLDQSLHDPLLGGGEEALIEVEFKAFVEACHLLGMKVIVDFVLRTVSRDNNLIYDHPDWFYWIHSPAGASFNTPKVGKGSPLLIMQDQTLKNLYACEGITGHLLKFAPSPDRKDPKLWEEVKKECQRTGVNILTLIEREMSITTVPGFSDVINDPQPPWTDVTYLKFYFDLHKKARCLLQDRPGPFDDDSFCGYAPFIMQDGACLNLYRGEKVNEGLWDYLVGVIPFYQERYRIDGARVDMGHAFPTSLLRDLVTAVKEKDPSFLLWSEEFSPEKAPQAKEGGFHFITGKLWYVYKKAGESGFLDELLENTVGSVLPVTAALETPDTPRCAQVFPDKRILAALVFTNYFLPNTVPYINNGMEMMERQPMNLGLGNTEEGRYLLDCEDPMYGKLAFFDNYRLRWLSKERVEMTELLTKAVSLRKQFIDWVGEKDNLLPTSRRPGEGLVVFCYRSQVAAERLVFLANLNSRRRLAFNLRRTLPAKILKSARSVSTVYTHNAFMEKDWSLNRTRFLEPGGVIIGLVNRTC